MQGKTGWLSPTGEFFACHPYEHLSIAHELAEPLHLPDYDFETNRHIHDDDKLLKSGWVHIGISILGTKEWAINWDWYHVLTPEQQHFLRPYFDGEFDLPMNPVTLQRWYMDTGSDNMERI